jgi:hypothetical protein
LIPPNDRVLPITRVVAAVVAAILVTATVVLYGFPSDTDRRFAWTIKPLMTRLLMGAGYGSAIYFYLRVLTERRWHRVAVGFIPTTAFTWLLLTATFLHWNKFHHGQLAFELWFWIYVVTPVLVPAIWLANRLTDPGTLEEHDARLPGPARAILAAIGVALCTVTAWMFLFPSAAIRVWPWMLTPLTARAIAGFIVIPGLTWLMMARGGRWSSCRVPMQTMAISVVLMGIAAARAWRHFDTTRLLTWVFVAGLAGTLLGLAALSVRMRRLTVSAR